MRGFAASLTAAQVTALRADPSVAAVEPDGTMHIDSVVPLKPGELALASSSVLGADWTDPFRRIDSIQSSASDPSPFVQQPGVVPGSRVYVVRVFDVSGSGSTSQTICGMDWVAANAARLNIKVATMSFGGGTNDHNCGVTDKNLQHVAICAPTAAGVTPVVAAGNANQDFGPDT